jgi:hypothetical protein
VSSVTIFIVSNVFQISIHGPKCAMVPFRGFTSEIPNAPGFQEKSERRSRYNFSTRINSSVFRGPLTTVLISYDIAATFSSLGWGVQTRRRAFFWHFVSQSSFYSPQSLIPSMNKNVIWHHSRLLKLAAWRQNSPRLLTNRRPFSAFTSPSNSVRSPQDHSSKSIPYFPFQVHSLATGHRKHLLQLFL